MSVLRNTRSCVSATSDAGLALATSAACGWNTPVRGMRSCSSSRVAWNSASAVKRRCIGWSHNKYASDSRPMPWWWAMNERTTACACPRGRRAAV